MSKRQERIIRNSSGLITFYNASHKSGLKIDPYKFNYFCTWYNRSHNLYPKNKAYLTPSKASVKHIITFLSMEGL